MDFDFINGEILLFDKPYEWTSFDVVNKIRYVIRKHLGIKKIKVGHAGTLDPLATGLLIICTGKFTKRINEFMGLEKEYTGTFHLGATTPSFDLETEIDNHYPIDHITEDMIKTAAGKLTGTIEQVPPMFSAIKHKGNRAYHYARNNKDIILEARKVDIRAFDITRIALPEVDFKITCSKGTYIRSIARDFGTVMNSGAYLSLLKRTKIGNFSVDKAMSPQQFEIELSSLIR